MVRSRDVLTREQVERRSANAIAQFLARRLTVPKIYLDVHWPNRTSGVDLIAVDRAGIGDIHVVKVKIGIVGLSDAIDRLHMVPAHYKYLALLDPEGLSIRTDSAKLFADNGIGRIGIIRIFESADLSLMPQLELAPERFALEPKYIELMDKFISKTHPFIEARA